MTGPECPLETSARPTVVDISVRDRLVSVVLSNGRVLCWGEDLTQQCGAVYFPQPWYAAAQACVLEAEVGFPMGVGRTWDDRVAVWGYERNNSAGDGTAEGPAFGEALSVPLPTQERVVSAVSGIPNLALTEGGNLWIWGDVALVAGTANDEVLPIQQPLLYPAPAPVAQVGEEAQCFVTVDREVYCFGTNVNGVLGLESPQSGQLEPVRIDVPRAQQLSESWYHACIVADDGSVWCWGWNAQGTMGLPWPDVGWHPSPSVVKGVPEATDVFAGLSGSCSLDRSGIAWCWSASEGTFGMPAMPPAPWRPELRFSKIGIGMDFACGLLVDGRVWCDRFGAGECLGCFMDVDSAIDDPFASGWK